MINDIKAKLPGKAKTKAKELDENEEEILEDATDPSIDASDKTGVTDIHDLDDDAADDEAPEDKSIVAKLKAKLAPKKAATTKGGKPAKKNINPVLLIALVGGGLVLLFLPEDEAPKDEVVDVGTKPVQKKRVVEPAKPVVETPATETPATEVPAETVAEDPTETPLPDAVVETPEETIPEPVIDTPVAEAPVDVPVSEPVIEEPVVTDIAPESVDSVDGQMIPDETSMTDKILEDLEKQVKKDQPKVSKTEYVSPPDYEYKGRGLVYNCTGKHWACIDGPSYKTCEDNFSSSTHQKKKIECYPFNVYEGTKGCEAMQNRVVSSNAKTEFCK